MTGLIKNAKLYNILKKKKRTNKSTILESTLQFISIQYHKFVAENRNSIDHTTPNFDKFSILRSSETLQISIYFL